MIGRAPYRVPFAHGVMFHRFHAPSDLPSGQASLTPDVFEEIIGFLGPANILPPSNWAARARSGNLRPGDRCITFDDGLLGQFDAALPVLDKYGLKAFWFIHSSVFNGEPDRNEVAQYVASRSFSTFSDFVEDFLVRSPPAVLEQLGSEAHRRFNEELRLAAPFYSEVDATYRFVRNELLSQRDFDTAIDAMLYRQGLSLDTIASELWMNDDHLRRLAHAGHWIGLHSYDHPFNLARLPRAEQHRQYARNQAHIEGVTGSPARSVAHPHNSYDQRTLRVLAELGIECGFRADMLPLRADGVPPGVLELAREDASQILALCRAAENS